MNAVNGVQDSPLHTAIYDGNLEDVERLLETGDTDVNNVGVDNKTPLHVAAENGHFKIVRVLLENRPRHGHLRGVDINAADTMGSTPLHYAVEKGHEPVVRELLDRREINPNAIAEHNDSKTPLHIAAEKGSLGIVKALLNSNPPIQVNAEDRLGSTALHLAAVGESVEVVQEILSYCKAHKEGVEPTNQRRATPLHVAALFGRDKIVSNLMAAGLPVNKTALSRHTPLHFAVQSGSWKTVRVLVKESENLLVSEADWKGHTPVDIARQACKTNENGFRPQSLPKQISPRDDATRMLEMLENFDVRGLQYERQSYADSANAILVGAALIASIAFASWLQPPLGFQPTYRSEFLDPSRAAPPNTYQPFVYFHSNAMKAFWIFNSMSFFFAIGSFLLGADVGFPIRYTGQREAVDDMRLAVLRASYFLLAAVACIVGAFICAGFTDLPSIPQDWGYMLAAAVVGGFPCGYGIYHYFVKIRSARKFQKSDTNGYQAPRP